MNARQLRRCLNLLNLLEARMSHTVHELAQECQVSTRTIYRDFRLLAEAGIHIHYDADARGHVAFSQYPATILRGFTREELTTLALAARTSYLWSMETIRGSVNQSISKIVAMIPPQKREGIIRLLSSCLVNVPRIDANQQVILAVLSALQESRQIRITFAPTVADGRLCWTKLASYQLTVSPTGWEIVGHSSMHRRTCCFRLSQIRAVEIIEDPITCRRLPVRPRRRKITLTRKEAVELGPDGLLVPLATTSDGQ